MGTLHILIYSFHWNKRKVNELEIQFYLTKAKLTYFLSNGYKSSIESVECHDSTRSAPLISDSK